MSFKCSENVPLDTICKEVSNAVICICIVINTFLTFHIQGENGLGYSQFWCIGTTRSDENEIILKAQRTSGEFMDKTFMSQTKQITLES